MSSEIKNVQYKEARILYKEMKKITSPFFISRALNIEKCAETEITNMLFNYGMLAFTKNCDEHTEIILYQLPSLEECGTVRVMLISDNDEEFVKESVSYIKKEFKTFAWKKIILDCIRKEENIRDNQFISFGFEKNMSVPYQYGMRDIFSVEIA